jgi:hypothetical protein
MANKNPTLRWGCNYQAVICFFKQSPAPTRSEKLKAASDDKSTRLPDSPKGVVACLPSGPKVDGNATGVHFTTSAPMCTCFADGADCINNINKLLEKLLRATQYVKNVGNKQQRER